MAGTTRLGLYGGARQPYGSFAGKTELTSGPHPVAEITRLGLYGGPRQLYGSFVGKTASTSGPHPVPRITRLGLYGGPRQLYGLFTNKTIVVVPDIIGGRRRRLGKRKLFFEGFELHLDFDLDFERLLPKEMLDILGVPILSPIPLDAPSLADIKEPIDREIAKLVREREVKEHGKLQQKRLELLQMLDMELYFMVLALLEDDF